MQNSENIKNNVFSIEVKDSYTEEEHDAIIDHGVKIANSVIWGVRAERSLIGLNGEYNHFNNRIDRHHEIILTIDHYRYPNFYEFSGVIEKNVIPFYWKYYPKARYNTYRGDYYVYTNMPISSEHNMKDYNNFFSKHNKCNEIANKYVGKYNYVADLFCSNSAHSTYIIESIFKDNFEVCELEHVQLFGVNSVNREIAIVTKNKLDMNTYNELKKFFRYATYTEYDGVTRYELGIVVGTEPGDCPEGVNGTPEPDRRYAFEMQCR